MKNNFKWCDNSLIRGPFFCLCLNEKEYLKQTKELGIKEPDKWVISGKHATVHYLTNSEGKLCCVVCLTEYSDHSTPEIYAVLTHEAVHIWQEFKEWIGETKPSREFEAYSIQAISQELFESFESQK